MIFLVKTDRVPKWAQVVNKMTQRLRIKYRYYALIDERTREVKERKWGYSELHRAEDEHDRKVRWNKRFRPFYRTLHTVESKPKGARWYEEHYKGVDWFGASLPAEDCYWMKNIVFETEWQLSLRSVFNGLIRPLGWKVSMYEKDISRLIYLRFERLSDSIEVRLRKRKQVY